MQLTFRPADNVPEANPTKPRLLEKRGESDSRTPHNSFVDFRHSTPAAEGINRFSPDAHLGVTSSKASPLTTLHIAQELSNSTAAFFAARSLSLLWGECYGVKLSGICFCDGLRRVCKGLLFSYFQAGVAA